MWNAVQCVGRAARDLGRATLVLVIVSLLVFFFLEGPTSIGDQVLALLPADIAAWVKYLANFVADVAANLDPREWLYALWTDFVREFGALFDIVAQAARAVSAHMAAHPSEPCRCTDMEWDKLFDKLSDLGVQFTGQLLLTALSLTAPLGTLLALWALDRASESTHWIVANTIKTLAWVVFLSLAHALGALIVGAFAGPLAVIAALAGPASDVVLSAFREMYWFLQVAVVILLVVAGGLASIPSFRFVAEEIALVQATLLGLLTSPVHPLFPRRPLRTARRVAAARRAKIRAFVDDGTLPALRTEYLLAPGDQRKFREHVVRRQVEEEGPPKLVNQFLEFPEGSPMVLKQSCLPEGPEEAVGQFVRLHFELQTAARQKWWMRLLARERPEEMIVPLLARVVDAAILADQHGDALRREVNWNGMPFFERIYAEYTPLPFPFQYFLRPFIGPGMPARVVIETHYPDVFVQAMPVDRTWFGIGIQLEEPNTPHGFFAQLRMHWGCKLRPFRSDRKPWAGAKAIPLCRRLKSQVPGVLSGKIDVQFSSAVPAPPGTVPGRRNDAYYIMPSGPLADGCPSVARPIAFPPPVPAPTQLNAPHPRPLPSSFERVKIPLPPRGSISNAPPAWLFPANDLFVDCRLNCLHRERTAAPQKMRVVQSALGKITRRPGLLPRRFRGPDGRALYRSTWSGAFIDHDLRIANRFPLFGCESYSDLRGAFAHATLLERLAAWLRIRKLNTFRGVVVSASGPEASANLLLPEPLLNDYLNHLAQRTEVLQKMKECKGPAFVPKPAETSTR